MVQRKDLQTFAFIWGGIFVLIAILPLFKGNGLRIWAIILSVFFIVIGFIKPEIVRVFYKIWTKIGTFIGGIVSKILLAILFYFLFTPIAFILRIIGKDLLNKNVDKTSSSYWIVRERQPESMKHQF